jgi:soluble lytic murein transglycosylase-like protein
MKSKALCLVGMGFPFLLFAAPIRPELRPHIEKAAATYRIDPKLVEAMVEVESAGDSFATSNKGARGLLQLMPRTADDLGVANAYHIQSNLMGACEYIRTLMNQFQFKIPHVLAAYNAGPHKVRKHGGIPPYAETRQYVKKVLAAYKRLRTASSTKN